ncbi:MAG: hypothetical protein D6835_07270 [Candidatus Thermofonsia bacterium]|nr:MAG: hypothetical protein D6835_07270 [Candidatus Thermofonsia bacterium]
MLDFLERAWQTLLFASFWIAVVSFFWGWIDTYMLLSKSRQKLKRGFRIVAKPISPDVRLYLESLQENVYETKQIFFKDVTVGFILVNGRERLIQIRNARWRTSWPYVGYVDLSQPAPTLEFRASLPMHLALLPFIITVIAIPFVALMMWFNYRNETKTIEKFLEQKAKEMTEGVV